MKEHKVSTLMYHIVCLGIEARYEIKFPEIGTEREHVHFLVQSVPTYSPEQIVRTIRA